MARHADRGLIAGLLDPRIYPHPVDRVELVETHISWVLLAGERVYKIKKPVSACVVGHAADGILQAAVHGRARQQPRPDQASDHLGRDHDDDQRGQEDGQAHQGDRRVALRQHRHRRGPGRDALDVARQLLPALHSRFVLLAPLLGSRLETPALRRADTMIPSVNFSRTVLEASTSILAVMRLGVSWCVVDRLPGAIAAHITPARLQSAAIPE